MYEPSVAAKVFHSRWAAYIDSVKAMPLTLAAASSAASRSRDLALERDRERVLLDRRLERARGGRPTVEDHRVAQGGGAGSGDAHGLARDPVRLGHRQDVAAGEAPRAIDQDADAEPFALPGGDAFDPTGLDGDRFVEPADDAYVRIPRAQGRGRIEGALGQVSHAAANLAEGSASDSRANDVFQRAGAAPTA